MRRVNAWHVWIIIWVWIGVLHTLRTAVEAMRVAAHDPLLWSCVYVFHIISLLLLLAVCLA